MASVYNGARILFKRNPLTHQQDQNFVKRNQMNPLTRTEIPAN